MLGKSVTCGPRGELTQASAAGVSEGLEVTCQERAGPVSGVSGFGRPWPAAFSLYHTVPAPRGREGDPEGFSGAAPPEFLGWESPCRESGA